MHLDCVIFKKTALLKFVFTDILLALAAHILYDSHLIGFIWNIRSNVRFCALEWVLLSLQIDFCNVQNCFEQPRAQSLPISITITVHFIGFPVLELSNVTRSFLWTTLLIQFQ